MSEEQAVLAAWGWMKKHAEDCRAPSLRLWRSAWGDAWHAEAGIAPSVIDARAVGTGSGPGEALIDLARRMGLEGKP